MITARTTLGSPVYASPEVPHALATLRVTSQELRYTASAVEVKPSTISPNMHGAFAKVDLPAFTFIGTYIGDLYDKSDLDAHVDPSLRIYSFYMHRAANSFPRLRDDGSIEIAETIDVRVIPRVPTNRDVSPGDFTEDMLNATPFVNEAPPGRPYNVMSVSSFAYDLHGTPSAHDPNKRAVVEFYTCRPVRAGEELFVHYGSEYSRGYVPNQDMGQCTLDKELFIAADCSPACAVLSPWTGPIAKSND